MTRIHFERGISPLAHVYDNVLIGKDVTIFPGAVVGRPPLGTRAASFPTDPRDLPPLEIGDGTVIGANAVIYQGAKIGKNCMICDTACIREFVEIGDSTLIAQGVTVNLRTKIGSRTRIMDNSHVTGRAQIGDDVFIGMLVTMANDNSMGTTFHAPEEMVGPTIEDKACIGQGSCLHPGVVIGRGATVGANSVVTKHVAPGAVVMGAPARERVR